MKGAVVATWISTSRELWGNTLVDRVMQEMGGSRIGSFCRLRTLTTARSNA